MTWVVWVLGALVFWGAWGLMIKVTLEDLSWQLLATVSLLGYLIPVVGLWLLKAPPRAILDRQGAIRSVVLGLISQAAVFSFYIALERGQASIVVPLTALYPGVTLIGAVLILRESLNHRQLMGLAMALVAAVLLSVG